MIRTYRELMVLKTFEDRYEYLKLRGSVGKTTFGFERYLNQTFYKSKEWRSIRRDVIIRDEGCDLGIENRKIFGRIIVHHLNPITSEDIENHRDCLFDMDNLICVSEETDRAIHYGDASLLSSLPTKRMKGDTCLWTASLQP